MDGLITCRRIAPPLALLISQHRSAICKARLLERFLEVLALLTAHTTSSTALTSLQHRCRSPPIPTYAELKAAAIEYRLRKAALVGPDGPLSDWVRAPAMCEGFCAHLQQAQAVTGGIGSAAACDS